MSTPPRQPPPEPPRYLPKEQPPNKLKGVLTVLALVAGIVGAFLLVGIGLIWATCTGIGRR